MFDLFVKDAFVVSLGKKLNVGVKDGKIAYLGEEEKPAKEVLRAEGKLLFPSFANMHTHLPMTLLRGLGADLPSWIGYRRLYGSWRGNLSLRSLLKMAPL
jgi:5-methylthioadenosine/S-adenosylhomocysteine deaminase